MSRQTSYILPNLDTKCSKVVLNKVVAFALVLPRLSKRLTLLIKPDLALLNFSASADTGVGKPRFQYRLSLVRFVTIHWKSHKAIN